MAYTITITEEWETETAVLTTTEAAALPGGLQGLQAHQSRQLYSQTVDQIDLPAVLKAVNNMGRKTRTTRGKKAATS